LNVVVTDAAGFIGSQLVERDEAPRGDMRDTLADTAADRRDLAFRSTVGLREGLEREWK
jgi:nucleoside-diphosphate-sugar epimerase